MYGLVWSSLVKLNKTWLWFGIVIAMETQLQEKLVM